MLLCVCVYNEGFFSSKLIRFGIEEMQLKEALTIPKMQRKIKIITDCEEWFLPDDEFLSINKDAVFLNNFDYHRKTTNEIRRYKQTSKNVLT